MATPAKLPRLSVGRPKSSDSCKKRRRIAKTKQNARSQIWIGPQTERWHQLKVDLGVKTHSELAKILMDRFQQPVSRQPVPMTSSTPGPSVVPTLSEAESLTGHSSLSGIQPVASSGTDTDVDKARVYSVRNVGLPKIATAVPGFSGSFVNPFELSIDVQEEEEPDSEEEYEPSVDITIGPVSEDIMEMSAADDIYGIEEVVDIDHAISEEPKRVLTAEEASRMAEEEFFLCSKGSLVSLANLPAPATCKECSNTVSLAVAKHGTAVTFKWECPEGHQANTWSSQPVMRRGVNTGDLLLSAAILFSGNNYQKVAHLFSFLNTPCVSSSSFDRFQRAYLVPTVEDFWAKHIAEVHSSKKDAQVVILGDGRMDSPGHSAQYCTYTAMDDSTKQIVSLQTVDKRETGRSSVRMEKEAFLRTLDYLEGENIHVTEVVTDAHGSIAAHLRKECPHIKHSFDVWHAAKNLAKKITKKGQEKQCSELKAWTKHIVNHFYHVCDTATTLEEFTGMWFGMLHHVADEHEWTLDSGANITKCSHGPLTEERQQKWLTKGSAAHNALRTVIADKRFLNQIPYYLNARSTAELESFNNLILMNAGKRFSYTPPVYRARCILAAIDHNHNLQRPVLLNKQGEERVAKVFNKKSGRWLLKPVKAKKAYTYKTAMVEAVLQRRVEDHRSLFRPRELKEDDPRRIGASIAPVPPPSTEELRSEQKKRLKSATQ